MWTTGVLLVLTHPNILQTYSYPIPVQNMSPRTVVADRCRKNLLVQASSNWSQWAGGKWTFTLNGPVNVYIDVDVEKPWFFQQNHLQMVDFPHRAVSLGLGTSESPILLVKKARFVCKRSLQPTQWCHERCRIWQKRSWNPPLEFYGTSTSHGESNLSEIPKIFG